MYEKLFLKCLEPRTAKKSTLLVNARIYRFILTCYINQLYSLFLSRTGKEGNVQMYFNFCMLWRSQLLTDFLQIWWKHSYLQKLVMLVDQINPISDFLAHLVVYHCMVKNVFLLGRPPQYVALWRYHIYFFRYHIFDPNVLKHGMAVK